MISEKSKKEFEEFVQPDGECQEAVTLLVTLVEQLFPGDIRKQGTALLAATKFFEWAHGPEGSSKH